MKRGRELVRRKRGSTRTTLAPYRAQSGKYQPMFLPKLVKSKVKPEGLEREPRIS
jgi:hypothetical protein